jgi:methyl-accepting chemotaxis protein
MKVYLDSHFENHPTITAEYVKFLATNSGFDKVEQMEATVKLLKERLDKAADAAEKATKKGQEATDKFSLVNKEMEALKKRLQTLEGKGK